MSQEIVEALRPVYEAWERGDFTAGGFLLDENIVFVVSPSFPNAGVFLGLEAVAKHMRELLDAWESLTVAAESYTEAGDSVLVSIRQEGVGAGSGVPTELHFFHVWTFRAGKAVRFEAIADETEALEAVGLRE